MLREIMKKDDFWVECNVCKRRLKNWVGSTPCCGSIAWVVEGEKVTNKIIMYAMGKEEGVTPLLIDNKNKQNENKTDNKHTR